MSWTGIYHLFSEKITDIKNTVFYSYEEERRLELEEDKKQLTALETEEKNIRSSMAKIISFIQSKPDLVNLFMQKYAEHQTFIAQAPARYEPQQTDRHQLLELITAKKIEILRLKHFVGELAVFIQSYPDLFERIVQETNNFRPETSLDLLSMSSNIRIDEL